MTFNEKKAEEIIEKYNLAPGTLITWRHRDKIPDKYASDLPEEISGENEQQWGENLKRALSTGKLNIAALCRLADVNMGRIKDFIRGNGKLYKDDMIALKKAINILRIEMKDALKIVSKKGIMPETGLKNLKRTIIRTELAWFVIIDRDKTIWNRLDGWVNNRRAFFPSEDKNKIASAIIIFLTETNI